MKRLPLLLIAACAVVRAADAPAQVRPPKPLFADGAPIHITIQAPIASLIRNRQTDAPVAGTLLDPAGQALAVSIGLRGHINRDAEVCDFPPLRVDFVAPPPPTSLFAGQKTLKLMTHCHNSPSAQKYLLLDYAAYRMYNILTPRSFGARLASVDYRDAGGRLITSSAAFFVEGLKDVAKRNGLAQVHAGERIPLEWLSAADAARTAMFEHMIANHDWSMRGGPAGEECCHNIKLIGTPSTGMAVPLPYDFDYSGMVGDPAATPPEALRIDNVRQRVYRGYCAHNGEALQAARQLREARPQLIQAITATPGLDGRAQQGAIAFLGHFFDDIATDQTVSERVLAHCVR